MIWRFSRLSKTIVENYHLDAFRAPFVLNLDLFILAWFLGRECMVPAFCVIGYGTQDPIPRNQYSVTTTRNQYPSIHESMNSLSHQLINPSTHQLWHSVSQCIVPGNQYLGTNTREPLPGIHPSTHESMNSLIHQSINPSIHQLCMAL